MDYRVLLKQYMRVIISHEGYSFVDSFDADRILSEEERKELEELETEIHKEEA